MSDGAADVIGHEKPQITYGLYSGCASLGFENYTCRRAICPAGGVKLDCLTKRKDAHYSAGLHIAHAREASRNRLLAHRPS